MLKSSSKIVLIFFILIANPNIHAQSFGFGCFGFVGGLAGYSHLSYQPGTLKYYYVENSLVPHLLAPVDYPSFGNANGFRVGLNFFRANFSDFHITAKGFYQFIWEDNSTNSPISVSRIQTNYNLNFKSWGIGLDFGLPVSKILSWKIIDGQLLFNTVEFEKSTENIGTTVIAKFKNDSPEIGYSLGTGFILSLIENYISLEGTAGYTSIKVKSMTDENGVDFKSTIFDTEEKEFIMGGGFSAVLQLNVGFPL